MVLIPTSNLLSTSWYTDVAKSHTSVLRGGGGRGWLNRKQSNALTLQSSMDVEVWSSITKGKVIRHQFSTRSVVANLVACIPSLIPVRK